MLHELVTVLLLATAAEGSEGFSAPLTQAAAVEQALAMNAEVRAAEAEVRGARARLAGSSLFLSSNPELTVGAGPREGTEGRSTDFEVALSQRFELGGQRGRRMAAAQAAVGAAEARLADARARVAASVRVQLGRIAAAAAHAELASKAEALAQQAFGAAERRVLAGDAARVEVNGARIERARASRAALRAGQALLAAHAELAGLLAVEVGVLPEIAFALEEDAGAGGEEPTALAREALEARPDVRAARLDLAAAEAEATLAGRAALPAPSIGLSFAREEGAQVVRGTLSMDLPVSSRNQGERGIAAVRVEQARLGLAELERRVGSEVRLAVERLRSARRGVEAFDAAAAAALEDNLASAARAYGAGQIDFVRHQTLTREALEARGERIDALAELNEAAARLALALRRVADPAH